MAEGHEEEGGGTDEASSVAATFTLEGYGSTERRLLKILPNGLPLYEPSGLEPLSWLKQEAEKVYFALDSENRKQQEESDPTTRNQASWENIVHHKASAGEDLSQLRRLLTLLQPEEGSRAKSQLTTVHSVRERPTEVEIDNLMMAFMSRRQAIRPMIRRTHLLIENVRRAISGACVSCCHRVAALLPACRSPAVFGDCQAASTLLEDQQGSIRRARFQRKCVVSFTMPHVVSCLILSLLHSSTCRWLSLPFPPCAADQDYPYRAETYVEVCAIPSECWAMPSDAPWLHFPPLPPSSPFKIHYAQLFVESRGGDRLNLKKEDTNEPTGSATSPQPMEDDVQQPPTQTQNVYVRIAGDPAHFVDHHFALTVDVHPLVPEELDRVEVKEEQEDAKPETHSPLAERTPTTPPPHVPASVTNPNAVTVYRNLHNAQWILADRACFCVVSGQALKLREEGGAPPEKVVISRTGTPTVEVDRHYYLTDLSPESISILVRNVPIYHEAPSPSVQPLTHLDVIVKIGYHPFRPSPSASVPYRQQPPPPSIPDRRLHLLPTLAVSQLRHLFLAAWKFAVYQSPTYCADISAASLPLTRHPPGENVLVDSLDWIVKQLAYPTWQ